MVLQLTNVSFLVCKKKLKKQKKEEKEKIETFVTLFD